MENEHDSPPPLQAPPAHVAYGFTTSWIILISALLGTFGINSNTNNDVVQICTALCAFAIWVPLICCSRKSTEPFIRGLKLGTLIFSAFAILALGICGVMLVVISINPDNTQY